METRKSIWGLLLLLAVASCGKDALEYAPTDSGSGDKMLQAAGTAITSLNGMYRSMWTAGWSTTGNTHQCFGIAAYNIAQDVMADDCIMQGVGNGWFWYDHVYNVKNAYTSSAWRSYDVWRAYYKWIAQSNYLIDAGAAMSGEPQDVAFVVGQAFAIRGMSYLYLAEWFARPPYNPLTGESRWNDPGVPIYTTGTGIDTGGKPRASLREVFAQVDADLDTAIVLLERGKESVLNKGNKSQISLYTALGLKSRSCLMTGDWEGAYHAAKRVVDEGEYAIGTASELLDGMNSIAASNVMWGAGIESTEQAGTYDGFYSHMDCQDGEYAKAAPKLINSSLYNHMGSGDIRRAWWDPGDKDSPYVSRKFKFSNVASWLGDYIYMRVEEMYFTAAEAALRLDRVQEAREMMNAVMAPRDPAYNANRYSGTHLGATTTTWTGSLLENILIQRRVELWGEYGRLFDVRRLGQGIDRKASDGFANDCLTTMSRLGINLTKPDTYDWVLTIPKAELDANPRINAEDQNP